jgi:hypothetical protein
MDHYAGIDVSLECSSVCVVDASGKIVQEGKVASEPQALIAWLESVGVKLVRIGLEAGPTSQWLYAAMKQAGLAVELLETRHVRDAFKAMPVKSDRNDARGIDCDFSGRWRRIKSLFTRRVAAQDKTLRKQNGEHAPWQARFWEHTVRDETDFARHADYIHYNPVKHGLVTCARDWPYSSFHHYVRQGLLPEDWGGGVDDGGSDFGERKG